MVFKVEVLNGFRVSGLISKTPKPLEAQGGGPDGRPLHAPPFPHPHPPRQTTLFSVVRTSACGCGGPWLYTPDPNASTSPPLTLRSVVSTSACDCGVPCENLKRATSMPASTIFSSSCARCGRGVSATIVQCVHHS
jgi:hypothetical protein